MSHEYPFRFRCQRSGNCCSRPEGRVRVNEEEIPGMAACLELSIEGFRSRYLVDGPHGDSLLKMGLGPACVFLQQEDGLAACKIYEARPSHCQTFPFWEELQEDGPMLRSAMRFCPGMEAPEEDSPLTESSPRQRTPWHRD